MPMSKLDIETTVATVRMACDIIAARLRFADSDAEQADAYQRALQISAISCQVWSPPETEPVPPPPPPPPVEFRDGAIRPVK